MRAAKSAEDAENEKDQDNLPKSDESDGLLLYIKSVYNTKNGAQCLLMWKKLLINMKKIFKIKSLIDEDWISVSLK